MTSSRGLHGIARDETLQYGPFKEPMEYAEEMIVTAWPGSWSRLEEVFDQYAVDRVPPGCIVLTEVPVEKAQSRRLRPVFAVERSLVLNESANRLSYRAMEASNHFHSSSPLPTATSRNAVMATLE
jgi:hypothetical protein